MSCEYQIERDKLAMSLKGIPGVLNVGMSKVEGDIVLAVIINSNLTKELREQIPNVFDGLKVVVKSLGYARAHFLGK